MRLVLIGCVVTLALLAWAWVRVSSIDVAGLADRRPGRTAMMRQREREAVAAGRSWRERCTWVPYERISPHLRHAVLIAEDDAFFSHDGLDWNEIRNSARQDLKTLRFARELAGRGERVPR